MITARIIFLFAICLPAFSEEVAGIRFVNGDHLTGNPISWDENGIVWNSSLIERPVPFLTQKVLDITLPTATVEQKARDHEAVVTLHKGGTLRGQLSEVTNDEVVIDTWYAGTMRFKRVMVKSVHIEPADTILYRGPNSLTGWKITPQPNAWNYANFSFLAKGAGSIARDDLLSDECSISFDVEWNSDAASYKVIVFADTVDTHNPKSGFEFSMQNGDMNLLNLRRQTPIGSTHSPEIAQSNSARIEIKASKRTGKIAYFINNKLVDAWTEENLERSHLGKGLHFSTSRSVPIRISHIRIAQWDGVIDQPLPPRIGLRAMQFGLGDDMPIPPQPAPKENEQGRMKLANGDSLDGEVKSIQNSKVTILTSLGEVTLPVSRLRTISLPAAQREEAIARNGDVRAWMADGDFVVFDFIGSDADTITGQSQNFGTATFRRDAFQKIEFNIYDFDLDNLRNPPDW